MKDYEILADMLSKSEIGIDQEMYKDYRAWLAGLDEHKLQTYLMEINKFMIRMSVNEGMGDRRKISSAAQVKLNQGLTFYALALWRLYEVMP